MGVVSVTKHVKYFASLDHNSTINFQEAFKKMIQENSHLLIQSVLEEDAFYNTSSLWYIYLYYHFIVFPESSSICETLGSHASFSSANTVLWNSAPGLVQAFCSSV